MSKIKDLTGQRFGRWAVRSRDLIRLDTTRWICECDCGKIKSVQARYLKNGKSKSCGCYMKDYNTKHGDSNTQFYNVWIHMKHRCNNPNVKEFHNYGGRGISVCNRWLTYENFKEDMYESYMTHFKENNGDTTLERINVNGNYELSNCSWITIKEQCKNKRTNKLFIGTHKQTNKLKISKNQKKFADLNNLDSTCINSCLRGKIQSHKGWNFKYILMECVE